MRVVKNAVHKALILFLFLLVPFFIFTLIASKSEVIASIRSFVVLTGSMQPTIPVGSVVYTQKFSNYQFGDVISFKRKDITVTHRVVAVEKNNNDVFYKTKGDANKSLDTDLVPKDKVIGRKIFQIPHIGNLVLFLKTLPGFLLLVALPAIIFIGFEFGNIKHEIEKEFEKRLLKNSL